MTMKRGGATPPQITTVDDMLRKIRAGTKEVYEISLRDFTVPVRVLSLDEMNQVRRFSIAAVAKIQGDQVDRDVEMQKAVLKLASNIDNTAPLLSDKLLAALTTDEVNHLYEEYMVVVDSANPSVETIPDAQFKELVAALKKNTITAKDCSLRQLRAICIAYQDLIQRPASHSSPPVS